MDLTVLKMSKISLNKSANLSKDLNLIEKDSSDGGDIYEYKDPFWDSCQSRKKVKASFLIVRVMSTLQEREVVL